jgi:hypothetical protein
MKRWWDPLCTRPTRWVGCSLCICNQCLSTLKLWVRILFMVASVLASSAVGRGLEPRSGQTKDYTIGICCFSAKHAALRRKSKYWLARHQDMCPSEPLHRILRVCEWLLFNANSAIFQLCHDENKLISMRWWWSPLRTRQTRWVEVSSRLK